MSPRKRRNNFSHALASFAGPDHDLLDDLVQDVFLRVVENLTTYAPSHPFARWIYTIALNVGRNHARRSSLVVPLNPDEFDETVSALETSDNAADVATLTRMVAQLPMAMREVVSLRVGSDMAYGDIAELLGIPEGSARSRMHNAIRILRDQSRAFEQRRSTENE